MLIDVGPAVGHYHPARSGRRAPDGSQTLGPQGRLAHAALAGARAAVRMRFLGFGHGLAHVKLLVQQAQQGQCRPFSGRVGVVGGPGGGHQRVQQHALTRRLARANRPQARPPLGCFGPAQLSRILDEQVGAGLLQLPGYVLAVWALQSVGRGPVADRRPCWHRPALGSLVEYWRRARAPSRPPAYTPAGYGVRRPTLPRQNASAPIAAPRRNGLKYSSPQATANAQKKRRLTGRCFLKDLGKDKLQV